VDVALVDAGVPEVLLDRPERVAECQRVGDGRVLVGNGEGGGGLLGAA
jgi:hypothetical protein